MVPPITTTGNTAVAMTTLSPAELAGVQVLFAVNPSNGGHGGIWVAQQAALTAAVNVGMRLVVFDRTVTNANVRGISGVTTVRDFSDNANFEPVPGNTIVNGPFGVIGPTTLDGGNSSRHGYSTLASLPAGSTPILTRTAASEIVMFGFRLGAGSVFYSTIPLDFYIKGSGNDPPRTAMNTILAPNSIAAAVTGLGGGAQVAVPTLGEWALVLLAQLVAGAGVLTMRVRARRAH
jgi:hypothetical protein